MQSGGYSKLERVHTNYAHALPGFLRKFWFFCDKDTQTYLRSKKAKFTKKEQSSVAAAARRVWPKQAQLRCCGSY
ncbi:MAG: hypothetical protein FWH43_08180, partial [Endomicrobia bacterium]|nr:hypothetical protein [Endomicrobiia bacterium]